MAMMHGRSSSLNVPLVTGGYLFVVINSFVSLGPRPKADGILIVFDEGESPLCAALGGLGGSAGDGW